MSAPVDVLAVMDRAFKDACASVTTEGYLLTRDIPEARAAVSELVSAAHAVERLATRHDGDDRMFNRLRAAIARCGGAK